MADRFQLKATEDSKSVEVYFCRRSCSAYLRHGLLSWIEPPRARHLRMKCFRRHSHIRLKDPASAVSVYAGTPPMQILIVPKIAVRLADVTNARLILHASTDTRD
jgi:hypothetical protein